MSCVFSQRLPQDVIRVFQALELEFAPEDRYSRFRLISWWDQKLLQSSKVMVVGAGALGNEVIKNLALLGIGKMYIVDIDTIEHSNLTRSVLFRNSDIGRYKAEVAAGRAKEINPDVDTVGIVGNIVSDIGIGLFNDVDLVIGGLDNREARVAINHKCWLANTPWIDGAIEVVYGIARVFVPPIGPCYECTMTEEDYRLLNQRRSCTLLSRDEMLSGKVPTTPTTASVIAGIQVQEAVKLLHDSPELPILAGKGFVFNGLNHDSYVVEYPLKENCYAHETIDSIIHLDRASNDTSLRTLLEIIRQEMGDKAVLEFNTEIVTGLSCGKCGSTVPFFGSLDTVTESQAQCEQCQQVRIPSLTHRILGREPYLDLTLSEFGLPRWDVVVGRVGMTRRYFELAGDRRLFTLSSGSEERKTR